MASKIKKKIVIIYHGNCTDGFGGAWAAWRKFGNRAEYIGAAHNEPPPRGLKNKGIYLIDFGYPETIIKKLLKDNVRVTAIDHHISRKGSTQMTHNYLYALNNSGAVLAWKYFHSKEKIPLMLRYIEDFDLWKFKIPYTRKVLAYLDLFDFNFRIWDRLTSDLEDIKKRKKIIEAGGIILKHVEKIVERLAANNFELVKFAGFKTLAVNSANFESELGYALVKKMPPLGIVWRRKKGRITVSLRSNGKIDVSKIAQKYGGGGHKEAAGFTFKTKLNFPWKPIK